MGRRKAGKVAQKAATVTASQNSKNVRIASEDTSLPPASPTPADPLAANGSASPETVSAPPKEDSSKSTPTFAANGSLSAESAITSFKDHLPESNGAVAKEVGISTHEMVAGESETATFKKAAQPQPQKQAPPAFTLSPFALLRSFLLFIITSILSQLAVLWEKPLKVVGGAGPLNDYILERLPLLRTPYR